MTPVITIDGPSGSGKGTVCQRLAQHYGWHFLDSGAIYRVLGYAASQKGIALDNEELLTDLALDLNLRFEAGLSDGANQLVLLDKKDISQEIRQPSCGEAASKVSQYASVRDALLTKQREFAKPPGLFADGRDMGTIVFPEAPLKLFLEASLEERAERRYKQLKSKKKDVNLAQILSALEVRDARDRSRPVAPLVPAEDAIIIDTTALSIDEVFTKIQKLIAESGLASR